MGGESDTERHARQTAEIYTALGRFVVDFEAMVAEPRRALAMLLPANPSMQSLINIVVHHQIMTAQPLFDIFYSVAGQIMADPAFGVPQSEQQVMKPVLKQIATDYADLVKVRNVLVHGTWYVGYGSSPSDDFSTFDIAKGRPNKAGLNFVEDYPRSAGELLALASQTAEVKELITLVHLCLGPLKVSASRTLKMVDTRWVRNGPPAR